jgi:type IV fimbrial biogenesis protein FimT
MLKVMNKNSGFTFIELMTTIAVIALLAAIAIPNMIDWRSRTKLQGAVENLRGDLQWAKLKAVQESEWVAVLFSANGYEVFTDNGPTVGAFDASLPDPERRLRNRDLPPDIRIDLGTTDFSGFKYVRFNNRGLPDNDGDVFINSTSGDRQRIELSRLGRIDITILTPYE